MLGSIPGRQYDGAGTRAGPRTSFVHVAGSRPGPRSRSFQPGQQGSGSPMPKTRPTSRTSQFLQTYTKGLTREDLQRLFTRDAREAYRFFARSMDEEALGREERDREADVPPPRRLAQDDRGDLVRHRRRRVAGRDDGRAIGAGGHQARPPKKKIFLEGEEGRAAAARRPMRDSRPITFRRKIFIYSFPTMAGLGFVSFARYVVRGRVFSSSSNP